MGKYDGDIYIYTPNIIYIYYLICIVHINHVTWYDMIVGLFENWICPPNSNWYLGPPMFIMSVKTNKHSDLVWTKLNFRRIIVFSPMNVGISGYSPLLDKCIWVRSFINDNQCKWDVSRQKSARMDASGQSNLSCWSKWPSINISAMDVSQQKHLFFLNASMCFPMGFPFSSGFDGSFPILERWRRISWTLNWSVVSGCIFGRIARWGCCPTMEPGKMGLGDIPSWSP